MYMGKLFTFEHLVARTKMEIICISQDCYEDKSISEVLKFLIPSVPIKIHRSFTFMCFLLLLIGSLGSPHFLNIILCTRSF